MIKLVLGCSSVVDYLPGTCEVPDSIFSTAEKTKRVTAMVVCTK
jgi:hypothetical protein